jgi:phospholipid/cholesterol/gamma-HCH transport system ATP-binding protein
VVIVAAYFGGCASGEDHFLHLSGGGPMSDAGSAVRFEAVSKAFASNVVLDKVSFQIKHGEAFCLLGRSGTGKSVTLKLMIGLLKPDQGKIFIEDKDIANLSSDELSETRKKMGFLFQNAALFDSISVGENLEFPLRRHTAKPKDERVRLAKEKLAEVGLEKEMDKMPADLSGGMRKRAGLARALMLDPQILLIDEPSSGLDGITAREIDELLLDLKSKQKKTLIVVTHDPVGARRFADRLGVLDRGRLIASGTPEELERSEDETVRDLVSIPKP